MAKRITNLLWIDPQNDFVVATGETHSVREFCELAFARAGLNYKKYVSTDPKFLRPAEVDLLLGDATKARERLGWSPTVGFGDLVREMVADDLGQARRDELNLRRGFDVKSYRE